MLSDLRLEKCLWVRSHNAEHQPVFKPMMRTLEQRGVKAWHLDISVPGEIQKLRDHVWKTDQHVILQGLLTKELHTLRPVFEQRKNFSVMPIDWWLTPFWFSQHATFNIFHNYNGIAVRTGRAPFLTGESPPWLMLPDRPIAYEFQCALLRPAALLAAPFIDLCKMRQRAQAVADPKRFLYYPFPIAEEDVPLHSETPQYDFTSLGSVTGPWLMRDPCVPAWLNFANLYADRRRLIDLIYRFNGRPFTVYDRRKTKAWVPWDELTRIIRQSRFVVCTGGLQNNSVPKFLEYTCLGVPMIGTMLPFEYPWLERCLVPVKPMSITPEELKPKLVEALEKYPTLRQNCLAMRDTLLRRYHPETLLDLLQAQIEGKPVPEGYLTAAAKG
jgi:hypothetical protein